MEPPFLSLKSTEAIFSPTFEIMPMLIFISKLATWQPAVSFFFPSFSSSDFRLSCYLSQKKKKKKNQAHKNDLRQNQHECF